MSRPSVRTTNPVRKLRINYSWSLEDFAKKCKIHVQGLYLLECGVYPSILPTVKQFLESEYGCDPQEIEKEYKEYVQQKREKFRRLYSPYILPESNLTVCPLVALRNTFQLSRLGFAKAICVQPSLLYNAEKRRALHFPGQLVDALKDVGYPIDWIEELNYRMEEYYYG